MKLLIGTPLYNNQIDSRTVSTIFDIIKEGEQQNITISWDRPSSCLLSYNRNSIVYNAVQNDFDWVLFIDADMEVKEKFLFQLLETAHKYNALMIGVPVRIKNQEEKKIWNFCYKTEKGYMNWEGALPQEPKEVDVVGTGIALINTQLFKEIPAPWFEQLDTVHKDGTIGFFPEDFYFCEKVKKAGHKIMIDPFVKSVHWGQWGYQ